LDSEDDGNASAGTPILVGYDEDTANNDTLTSLDNGEEKAHIEMVSELDNGDAASSYDGETVTPGADTRASSLVIEDANLLVERADERNWEPIDVTRRGFLGATLSGGMVESHTLGSNADMMDVSDGPILFEKP
jgi:hypothetical protein